MKTLPAPARVRVRLATYRRHDLLPRAVASLRAQTLPDWVCEVHNDDPADPFPAELIRKMGDPRFTVVTHPARLGGAGTFNLIFRSPAEPYYSLLEDDNWWDPAFLATMLAALEAHPTIDVAWCNQRVWTQGGDGSWLNTGRLVNPPEEGPPRLVPWGEPRQALGAVHANGAMMIRSKPGRDYLTPSSPFTSVEAFRERLFRHPLLYVPTPVAHFAVTAATTRTGEIEKWSQSLVLLAASFVRRSGEPAPQICRELWRHYAAQRPAPNNLLLWAGLIEPTCRPFWRCAGAGDWLRWLAGMVRRPAASWRMARARRLHPEWWKFLDEATRQRFHEARPAP